MNKTVLTRKPIQAGDYGKNIPKKAKNEEKDSNVKTDGRKVLALWKHS